MVDIRRKTCSVPNSNTPLCMGTKACFPSFVQRFILFLVSISKRFSFWAHGWNNSSDQRNNCTAIPGITGIKGPFWSCSHGFFKLIHQNATWVHQNPLMNHHFSQLNCHKLRIPHCQTYPNLQETSANTDFAWFRHTQHTQHPWFSHGFRLQNDSRRPQLGPPYAAAAFGTFSTDVFGRGAAFSVHAVRKRLEKQTILQSGGYMRIPSGKHTKSYGKIHPITHL